VATTSTSAAFTVIEPVFTEPERLAPAGFLACYTGLTREAYPLDLRQCSEATGANIQALGVERGHRTLVIIRKGGKVVTIPLAPRTARAIDLAVRERPEGPTLLAPYGQRLDRHWCRPDCPPRRWLPGSADRSGPTPCGAR
jgi:hypothetical protein